MTIQEKLYTADEFWEICQEAARDLRLELREGVIYEMPPTSAIPTVITGRIVWLLNNFVIANNLGYVSVADGAFRLSDDTVLVPDAAYISKERLPELPDRFFPIAPDLAVEVDSIKAVQRNALQYLTHGTSIVWIVYPAEQSVDICVLGDDGGLLIHEVTIEGALDGGQLLPGLKLELKDVFPSSN